MLKQNFGKFASRAASAFRGAAGFMAPNTAARHNGPQSTHTRPTAHMPRPGR